MNMLYKREKIEGKIEGNIEQQNLVITNAYSMKGLDISFIARLNQPHRSWK